MKHDNSDRRGAPGRLVHQVVNPSNADGSESD